MINPVNIQPRSSGGSGGLWGKIAGGIAGALAVAASPLTGGASLAALPAAIGAGGMLGGTIGNVIDPQKVSQRNPLQTVGQSDPGVMLAQLNDASKAAMTLPQTDSEPLLNHFGQAGLLLKRRLGVDPTMVS